MTITCDTSLSEILSSEDVASQIEQVAGSVRNNTESRLDVLSNQLQSDVIKNSIIDGETIMSTKGATVENNFTVFHSSLDELVSGIKDAASRQEADELDRLRSAVMKKISEIDSDIQDLEGQISALNSASSYAAGMIDQNLKKAEEIRSRIKVKETLRESYRKKLAEIESRQGIVGENGNNVVLFNEMATFTLDANGRPTTQPLDFVLDSHHRLDVPGFGLCYEATGENKLEFHYNPETNLFYSSSEGTDWSTYDYANDIYTIEPEDMLKSKVKGGICIF